MSLHTFAWHQKTVWMYVWIGLSHSAQVVDQHYVEFRLEAAFKEVPSLSAALPQATGAFC
jgi:hypothetical protein